VLARLTAASGDVVLLAAPLHPVLRDQLGARGMAEYRAYLGGLARPGLRLMDCSELLDASGFDDELHPNAMGCAAITRQLAAALDWSRTRPAST
jgi:hypothetical protein